MLKKKYHKQKSRTMSGFFFFEQADFAAYSTFTSIALSFVTSGFLSIRSRTPLLIS